MPKGKAGGWSKDTLWRDALVILLLALAVLIVLDQANPLTTRLGRDSGVFAYIGSRMLGGDVPYVHVWDHKPPIVLFINAAGLQLARGSRWGIWLMEFVFLSGATFLGYAALRKAVGSGAALLASFAWLAGLGAVLQGGNLTEEYSLLFGFSALWLFLRTLERPDSDSPVHHAGIGVAFGLAALTRPNNAGVQTAILVVELLLVILKQRSWRWLGRSMLATAIGLAVPAAAVSAFFTSHGALREFLNAAFLYNLYYANSPDIPGALKTGVQCFGALAGLAIAGVWLGVKKANPATGGMPATALWLWMCVNIPLEIVLSGLSGRNFAHYFINWLPWMAVALAAPSQHVVQTFRAGSLPKRALLLTAALGMGAWIVKEPVAAYATTFRTLMAEGGLVQRRERLAEYVNAHTEPGDTVLIWGGGVGTNFLARRDSPSAYFLYGILADTPMTEDISAAFYADIQRRPPVLIVDDSLTDLRHMVPALSEPDPRGWMIANHVMVQPRIQEFFAFLQARYELKTSIAGVPIYALNR